MRVMKLWDPELVPNLDWVRPEPKMVEGMEDLSPVLGPGVYVLWRQGKVVHVAWAKNVLERIATHRQLHGERIPSWVPVKGFRFDRVTWKPCPEHRSEQVLKQLREALLGESAVS